jgi:PqqD family protein of HPr-rel-A system
LTSITTTKWRVSPDADLRWRFWGDEAIVFHPPSGDTHVLHPIAAEVLQYLCDRCADLNQIASFLASQAPAGGRPDAADPSLQVLTKLLTDFDQLGLIEPAHETS